MVGIVSFLFVFVNVLFFLWFNFFFGFLLFEDGELDGRQGKFPAGLTKKVWKSIYVLKLFWDSLDISLFFRFLDRRLRQVVHRWAVALQWAVEKYSHVFYFLYVIELIICKTGPSAARSMPPPVKDLIFFVFEVLGLIRCMFSNEDSVDQPHLDVILYNLFDIYILNRFVVSAAVWWCCWWWWWW